MEENILEAKPEFKKIIDFVTGEALCQLSHGLNRHNER
jgi:hypothetical protein